MAGGETERDEPGAIGEFDDRVVRSDAPDRGGTDTPRDDSGTIRKTPRHALIDALASAVRDGAEGGDVALVKIATRALADLADTSRGGAKVIDLNEGRGRSRRRE